MNIFAAGATGVLGRPTVKALVEAGHSVRGAARGEEKAAIVRSLGAEPVAVDLFDPASVKEALVGTEAVLHLATKIPSITRMRWKGAWKENDRLRRDASRNLVDAAIAAGAQAFLQESITFLYADGGEEWLDEDSPIAPSWVALDSMLAAETETSRFSESGGRGISLRYGAFYAPYAQSTLDTVRFARRRLLPVPGKGSSYASSIHVDDGAAAAVAALNLPSGVYNIVDDEPLRARDYAGALCAAFGFKPPRRVPVWLFRIALGGPSVYILRSQRVSNARFKQATGWSPRYPSAREGWQAIAAELRIE